MNDLKTAEQFYQASLENLNKAKELHEAMDATSRKTIALFSRFIEATVTPDHVYAGGEVVGCVEKVEQQAIANLEAIQQRDVLAVINSIIAMTLEAPDLLTVSFNASSATSGFNVIVWEGSETGKVLLSENVYVDWSLALERAIDIESKLAELIIDAKDSAEAAA